MSSYLKIFLLCFALGSCSFINFDAPRNIDNACSILQQRPSFNRAFQKQNVNGEHPFTFKWRYCTKRVNLSQMQKRQENTFLALFLGVVKVQHMATPKLWMALGLIIKNLQEDASPVAQIFMMLLISWDGTCKNQEDD